MCLSHKIAHKSWCINVSTHNSLTALKQTNWLSVWESFHHVKNFKAIQRYKQIKAKQKEIVFVYKWFLFEQRSLSLTAVALWMSCAQIFSITSYVLQILHLHKKCAVASRHRRSYVRWIFVTINPSDCTFHICFSLYSYISFHVVSFVQISNIFLSFFRFYLFPLLCLPSLFSLVEIRYSFSVNGFALLFSRCTKKFTFTQSSVSCCFCGKEEKKNTSPILSSFNIIFCFSSFIVLMMILCVPFQPRQRSHCEYLCVGKDVSFCECLFRIRVLIEWSFQTEKCVLYSQVVSNILKVEENSESDLQWTGWRDWNNKL